MTNFGKTAAMAFILGALGASSPARAQCTIPNVLTNGQVADASEVMDNFNAVATCADATLDAAIKPSGTPQTGEIAVFSGDKTITGGNLSGDVSTSGGTTTTLSSTGVTPGSYTNAQITVDGKGRVTSAASGVSGGGGGGLLGLTVLRKTANQTVSTSWVAVTWDAELYDNLTTFNPGSTSWTVPSGANWMRISSANFPWSNVGGNRWISVARFSGSGTQFVTGDISSHLNESFESVTSSWIPVVPGATYGVNVLSSVNTWLSGVDSNFGGPARITIEWAVTLSDLHG